MALDFIRASEAEQFTFYRIPKALFTNVRYANLSVEAKVLYGLLLDRVSLSIRNHWVDEQDRVYIIFTNQEAAEALGCGGSKVTRLFKELEEQAELIQRKPRGLGKPCLIYVRHFLESSKAPVQSRENHESGLVKTTSLESSILRPINTETNKTERIDIDSILSGIGSDDDPMRHDYEQYLEERLQLEVLRGEYPGRSAMLDEIKALLVDTLCAKRKSIRVCREDLPTATVKAQLMKLEADHIRMVMDGLLRNTTQVRNIKQYLLSCLYTAPSCMDIYYQSQVNHDLSENQPQT